MPQHPDMRWSKIGKIFDPTDHALPLDCLEYAQSPQTLIFDDRVRIFFSTRKTDPTNGKFLSHIAFIDIDKKFRNIMRISQKPVIPLGDLGSFDEHGIFPISITRTADKILAYTCGWNRRKSVSVDTGIGYAISHDNGETFERLGTGPIMGPSLHEPFLVGDAFVRIYGGVYHMWYMYGVRWVNKESGTPERVYKIGHATSQDGINWDREGRQIISDEIDDNECQALPTVIFHKERYHMFFCYRHAVDFRANPEKSYRIGYAWSDDLQNWKRHAKYDGITVTKGDWDADMLCYPHVFECNGNVYLLYNGNQFGKYGFGLAILQTPV